MRYSTGFNSFAYRVRGGSTLSPLIGAQKLAFSEGTDNRDLIVRLDSGDVIQYSETVSTGRTATLDIVQLPADFLKNVLGYTQGTSKVLVEGIQRTYTHFSLFYQYETDTEPVRVQLYDVVCAKPNFDVTTITNRPSVDIKKLKLIINPDISAGAYSRSITRSENASLYDSWFGVVTT